MGWDVPDVHYSGKRAYYYAQLVGPGSDGAFAIEQSHNDCTPDCAGGKITRELLRWNGHDYLP